MIKKQQYPYWRLINWLLALALLVPLLFMMWGGITASIDLFAHLWQTVLPTYVSNTLLLALLVVVFSIVLGLGSAALVTQTNIKSKSIC